MAVGKGGAGEGDRKWSEHAHMLKDWLKGFVKVWEKEKSIAWSFSVCARRGGALSCAQALEQQDGHQGQRSLTQGRQQC